MLLGAPVHQHLFSFSFTEFLLISKKVLEKHMLAFHVFTSQCQSDVAQAWLRPLPQLPCASALAR